MIKKRIIELICALIPFKDKRIKARHFLKNLDVFSDIHFIRKFNNAVIEKNTVLIYEPNICHAECIPSYLKKFKDEGYNVHLLMPKVLNDFKPLCRVPQKYHPDETFLVTPTMQKLAFNSPQIEKYEKIFIATTENYYNATKSVENLKLNESLKNKLLLMEHDYRNIKNFEEEEYLKNKQLFMITNFSKNADIQVFVPDYFGDIKITQKNKHITKFVTVGAFDPKRRNINLMFEAVEKLLEKDIKNFIVTAIGAGKTEDIKKEIIPYIRLKGRLDCEETYSEIEEADFFLPLLDPTLEKNRDYLQFLTTGSKQIVTGFKKPWLINEEFAKVYGFDDTNSIVYKDNELYEAMHKAINMTCREYEDLQKNIEKVNERTYA